MGLLRVLQRILEWFGLTADLYDILVFFGIPAGLAMLTIYFGWDEQPHLIIFFGVTVFALGAVAINNCMQIIERTALFHRINIAGLKFSSVGYDPSKKTVDISMVADLMSIANIGAYFRIKGISLVVEGRTAPTTAPLDANVVQMLPHSNRQIAISTIPDIPHTGNMMHGKFSIDIVYGKSEDSLKYRCEFECQVHLLAGPVGSKMQTSHPVAKHSKWGG